MEGLVQFSASRNPEQSKRLRGRHAVVVDDTAALLGVQMQPCSTTGGANKRAEKRRETEKRVKRLHPSSRRPLILSPSDSLCFGHVLTCSNQHSQVTLGPALSFVTGPSGADLGIHFGGREIQI